MSPLTPLAMFLLVVSASSHLGFWVVYTEDSSPDPKQPGMHVPVTKLLERTQPSVVTKEAFAAESLWKDGFGPLTSAMSIFEASSNTTLHVVYLVGHGMSGPSQWPCIQTGGGIVHSFKLFEAINSTKLNSSVILVADVCRGLEFGINEVRKQTSSLALFLSEFLFV